MKSLLKIEEAIARLPTKARRRLVQGIPALCPGVFSEAGWDVILYTDKSRKSLSFHLDKLDAEYAQSSKNFLMPNDKSLRAKK